MGSPYGHAMQQWRVAQEHALHMQRVANHNHSGDAWLMSAGLGATAKQPPKNCEGCGAPRRHHGRGDYCGK